MMRWMLLFVMCVGLAGVAQARFAEDVEQLGHRQTQSGAIERLARAGADAFDDLLEGLKQDPNEEGISADVTARRHMVRTACAQLLGALGDTNASATLLELLRENRAADSAYPAFGGSCARALGQIWSDKDDSPQRREVVTELAGIAADSSLKTVTRWGALRGLAAMRTGAEVAVPLLSDDVEQVLRSAAMEVLAAAGRGDAAGNLIEIWNGYRTGESAHYTHPLGLQALFAAARLGHEGAVAGLVDVATMAEFATLDALRKEAVRLMRADGLRASAIAGLVNVFIDGDRATQHRQAAQTLGEFGADGVAAYLAISEREAPEGKEETHYRDLVDRHLTNLRSDSALSAFVAAYGSVDAENSALRGKIIDHLLNNRNQLKEDGIALFRAAADDESLESPKRASCINAYAESRGSESFDDLSRWATSDVGVIRAQAVQNLGRNYIPAQRSQPLLIEALKSEGDDFVNTRRNALQGLQRSADKELLPVFLERLDPEKESSAEVRTAAVRAIDAWRSVARVRDDEVFPSIRARLADEDETVRAAAIRVTVMMAQRMGENRLAVEVVEQGLNDESEDVRIQAYAQITSVATDIDAEKVFNAALLEESPRLQGQALQAVARLRKYGEGETRRKLIDLAFRVLSDRTYERDAVSVLRGTGEGAEFNNVSGRVRGLIEEYTTGGRQEYDRVPALIDVLIGINDNVYFTKIKELARVPNVQLRRKCVEYVQQFGTRDDLPWLRELMDRSDSAAPAVRSNIEDAISMLEGR